MVFYWQNCGIVIRSNKIVSSCILKSFIRWHSFFQRRPPTVSVDINMRFCVLSWLIENHSAIFNMSFEFTYNCLVNLKTWLKRGSWIAIRSFDVSFHEVFNMPVWNTCRFTGKFTLCVLSRHWWYSWQNWGLFREKLVRYLFTVQIRDFLSYWRSARIVRTCITRLFSRWTDLFPLRS